MRMDPTQIATHQEHLLKASNIKIKIIFKFILKPAKFQCAPYTNNITRAKPLDSSWYTYEKRNVEIHYLDR